MGQNSIHKQLNAGGKRAENPVEELCGGKVEEVRGKIEEKSPFRREKWRVGVI